MSQGRVWLGYVLLPFALVLGIDQASKTLAQSYLVNPLSWGPFILGLHYNTGFFLGGFKDASQLLTVILPVSLGGFLVYAHFVLQYFLPIASKTLRIGLSVLFASFISNVVDRFRFGSVVDFIFVKLGVIQTGVFNIADSLQWLGVGLFFFSFIRERNVFYPPEDRRGRLWIDPYFQGKYCLTLIFVGASFGLISGFLSHSFLQIVLSRTSLPFEQTIGIQNTFTWSYLFICAFFFVSLFLIGIRLSHRIVGPVKSFSRFLDDLINGKNSQFKLRERDEFMHFEELAMRFQTHFHENLGMIKPKLETGMKAPFISGTTFKGERIGPEYFEGKKSWVIFYRYASCPLCALHLSEIRPLIDRAKNLGIAVAVVYENAKDKFIKPQKETGEIGRLLGEMQIPLIADPEKKLYFLYRTQKSVLGLISFKAITTFLRAKKSGYLQGSIDGELSQLPAHFFLGKEGKVVDCYYGTTIADHPPRMRIEKFLEI